MKDEQTKSTVSQVRNDSKVKLIDLNNIKELKGINDDHSAGFVCDVTTGICGPVNQKKEGKE